MDCAGDDRGRGPTSEDAGATHRRTSRGSAGEGVTGVKRLWRASVESEYWKGCGGVWKGDDGG